jgi:hypothetical protein
MRTAPSCFQQVPETRQRVSGMANLLGFWPYQIHVVRCLFLAFPLCLLWLLVHDTGSRISTLVDRFKSYCTLGQNTLSKYESKVFRWTVVPRRKCISIPPSMTMKS